jgi:hypothetical protein
MRTNAGCATLIAAAPGDHELVGSVACHFLQWLGTLVGAWQWCLYARTALERPAEDEQARVTLDTAAFYAAHVLPRALMHEAVVNAGSEPVAPVPPTSV